MAPAADYTPSELNDDATRGCYARAAGLIARRKEARKDQGPVLVLDADDFSMGAHEVGEETFKVHLDGYNLLPLLTGQTTESPRREFFYFGDEAA
jgi:hypothetical protein